MGATGTLFRLICSLKHNGERVCTRLGKAAIGYAAARLGAWAANSRYFDPQRGRERSSLVWHPHWHLLVGSVDGDTLQGNPSKPFTSTHSRVWPSQGRRKRGHRPAPAQPVGPSATSSPTGVNNTAVWGFLIFFLRQEYKIIGRTSGSVRGDPDRQTSWARTGEGRRRGASCRS